MVEEGGVVMVKSPELLTVPAEVVMESLPVVAPEGTTATSWVVVPYIVTGGGVTAKEMMPV